jgi:hypothetical protein
MKRWEKNQYNVNEILSRAKQKEEKWKKTGIFFGKITKMEGSLK